MPTYVQIVVRHPCVIVVALLGILLPVAFFGVLNFKLSDPDGGQLVRDSLEAEQSHAFQRAAEVTAEGLNSNTFTPQQTSSMEPLKLYYVAGSTADDDRKRTNNVLTVENIQKMAALEDELIALSGGDAWREVCRRRPGQKECAPLISAVPFLRHATDEASLHAAIDQLYAMLDDTALNPLGGVKASWFFEQNKDTGSRYSSYIMRTHMELGCPLAPFDNDESSPFLNCADREGAQKDRAMSRFLTPAEQHLRAAAAQWEAAAGGDNMGLLFAQEWLYSHEYGGIILSDLTYVLGSIGCVFVVLWAYTSSSLLALLGLLQVLLSFPVTLFIYAVVLRIQLFGVLQAMAIFVILGIGADDVLILTGALLLEADHTAPAEARFASAFRSAFTAMLTTSVTTAAAFGMTAVIKIPTVRYFAVFCSLMVAVNFVLVCTLYLAALALWDRHLRFRRCCALPCAPPPNPLPNSQSRAQRTTEPADATKPPSNARANGQTGVSCIHRSLHAFSTAVGHRVTARPRSVLAVFGVAAAILLGFAVTLGDPQTERGNPYWAPDHPLGRRWNLEIFALTNESASTGIELFLVMGIDGIDRTGTDPTDDDDLGVAVFHPHFDLASTDAQEYCLWLCSELDANAAELQIQQSAAGGGMACLMRELQQWRLARQQSFPIPPAEFQDTAREFLGRKAARRVQGQLGLVLEGDQLRLRFSHMVVQTEMALSAPFADVWALKQTWLNFLASLPARRPVPPSIGPPPFMVSRPLIIASTIAQAKGTAWTSVGASTALAFFVLLVFTHNMRIALLATLTIGCVVAAVVGLVNIYGWKLDTFEAVCITILVGFSVDYTVHLGIAYGDRRVASDDRVARAQHAISTLGISVTAGAASTAGACLFLFPATITFLPKFGIFMLTAVVSAFCFAMCAFSALLATLGPVGKQGDLPAIRQLLQRCGQAPAPQSPPTPGGIGLHPLEQISAISASHAIDAAEAAPEAGASSTSAAASPPVASDAVASAVELSECAAASRPPPRRRAALGGGCCTLPIYLALIASVLVLAVAFQYWIPRAGDDDSGGSGDAAAEVSTYRMPPINELEQGVWEELRPQGATICSRGTPYAFYVRRGAVNKVVLEFMGGGACWSNLTCGLQKSTFSERVDGLRPLFAAAAAADRAFAHTSTDGSPPPSGASAVVGETDTLFTGAGNKDRAADEANWTHVFVPYCTGDIHWGNASVEYLPGVTVHHRGAVNAQAAVDWMLANVPSPEVALVTGCSAGAYGSLMWATKIAPVYIPRGTRLVQFGDSGSGVFTQGFIEEAYPNWNTAAVWPWEVVPPEMRLNLSGSNAWFAAAGMGLSDFYEQAAIAYPEARWSQYTSAYDHNQAFYLEAMADGDFGRGEPPLASKLAWSHRMRRLYNATSLRALPNYAEWIGRGDEHCVILSNRYWWTTGGGTSLPEWVRAQARPGTNVTSVDCADDDSGGQSACLVGVEQ